VQFPAGVDIPYTFMSIFDVSVGGCEIDVYSKLLPDSYSRSDVFSSCSSHWVRSTLSSGSITASAGGLAFN